MFAALDQYVEWILQAHSAKYNHQLPDDAVRVQIKNILIRHALKSPEQEDFVALTTHNVIERLQADDTPNEPLTRTVEKAADAVRHQLLRAAQRWRTTNDKLAHVAGADHDSVERLKIELLATFSTEEHIMIEAILEGHPTDAIAKRLDVSESTIYRRLRDIRDRLKNSDNQTHESP